MAVPSVFVSSVICGLEQVRERAAEGVERVGMYPIRSERLSASSDSPKRALLDQVSKADIYLLLIGERYGDIQPSPTEQEYEEAVRLRKPILILVQEGQRDPNQEEFLARVRGGWEGGILSGTFSNSDDVAAAVAAALGRHQAGIVEDAPTAQAKARELATRTDRHGASSGVAARVAFVPLRQTTLLDAEALDVPSLGDDLSAVLRDTGVVSQRIGLDVQVTGAGVHVQGTDAVSWVTPEATIHSDGAIVALGAVAVDDAPMGFSLVDPDKLGQFVRAAGRFAQATWDRIDERREVAQVAVVAAIPDASYKGFGRAKGSSMTVSMRLPEIVVAPEPAEVVPRGQVDAEHLAGRVVAAVKRIFSDGGGLQG